VRLPLTHPPPAEPATPARCAYLELLARAAVGLPLGAAAAALSSARSRGRHGNALQWHLGLAAHDANAEPDWEGRIELKLVTVWRARGRVVCDKLKVCDAEIDPGRKLANVMFVLADRTTRVVVGHRAFTLQGPAWAQLAASWHADLHFDAPSLFMESRQGRGGASPAYYVSAAWLSAFVLHEPPGVLEPLRAAPLSGEPLVTLVEGDGSARVPCPRCGGPLTFEFTVLRRRGLAPAHHGMPLAGACAIRPHIVVERGRVPASSVLGVDDRDAALQGACAPERIARLVDLVPEPLDHGH
jgi:hypothetical protein